MRTLSVRTGYHRPDLPDDGDVTLVMPDRPRAGGLDLIGKGHSLRIDGGNLGNGRIIAAGSFNELHLSGLRGDFRDVRSDGIDLACAAKLVTIQNTRLTGLHGEHAGFHGDGIQLQLGSRVDTLAITNTTIASGYQAIMCGSGPDGLGVKRLYLDRVNIRDEPSLRSEPSIALYLGDTKESGGRLTLPYEIVLGEVWVDWPDRKRAMYLPRGARVTGSLKYGVPPGGDFCRG
ncbi:hypothetical protein [Methylobacterium oryzihabitans]|uniref:Right-handed parallel beta-helix repeat-containing protein n=1 Tax=Methylobacterium oryzihabitans TaxID=2499852 RepID=A0A437PC75_9HYPH|nr:hypothetical protein [Methylobacterium oryzihabitans]RVU19833.1 hypothetical protein EOE48_07785 [Methylobacterium oryzihabitans]